MHSCARILNLDRFFTSKFKTLTDFAVLINLV
nr:MAG TPA: hypothetical protein [Inoviridae sp.]